MTCSLTPHGDLFRKIGPEEDQAFGIEATIFDEAEGQRIDTGAPGHIGEAFAG